MTTAAEWELEVRPRRVVWIAGSIAVVLVVFFTVGAIMMRRSWTGVTFNAWDQIAVVVIGVLIAAGVMIQTRPRLKAGPQGVLVRNIIGEQFLEWTVVRGLSFPEKKAWARLELPADEYIPVLAIRAADKEYAVDAVERFRALGARYAG